MMKKSKKQNLLIEIRSTVRSEVVTTWLRKYRSRIFQVYVLIALISFGALAFLANAYPYLGFDLPFTREMQADVPTWFGFVLQAVSWPGYTIQSFGMIALGVILLGLIGLRWEALTLFGGSLASGILNSIVKMIVRRPRPPDDLVQVMQTLNSYSFPSGHAMFYTIFFGFLLFLTFTLLKKSWLRAVLSLFLAAMIVLIGPSRVFLGEHWASDVLGGYLLGSLVLILLIQFYHWGKDRYLLHQPVAPADSGSEDISIREEVNHPSQPTQPKQ